MKDISGQAVETFQSGFNCAQAVLSPFCERYHLEKELALKIASGLGTGFRCGEVCGAVSGAVLVIGLKDGQSVSEDMQTKKHCYEQTEAFLQAFSEKNGTILCRELLGYDLSTPDGREQVKRQNLFASICEDKIRDAVQMLEALGY